MIGFLDESGAPGIAKTNNDFLVVSLIIFENRDESDKCSEKISKLRDEMKLPDSYEFHYSRNSNKTREAFIKLIGTFNFRTITIAIRKNDFKRTATYHKIAYNLVREILSRYKNISITIDSNPILLKELKQELKANKSSIPVKSMRSQSNNLIQLADYVVALSTRKLKGTDKAINQYRPLIQKQDCFIEINE